MPSSAVHPVQPRLIGTIVHPAWAQARRDILTIAARGPATIVLLGQAGTGKSWLLRNLGMQLRQGGAEVTLLRQGDLPWTLSPDAVLLIDEASRLATHDLTALLTQTSTLVVLADLPRFAGQLEAPTPPQTVTLQPLEPDQVGEFVTDWMQRAGHPGAVVTPAALERLAEFSAGTPRLLTQLLSAALALGKPPLDAADIESVAAMRTVGIEPAVRPAATADPPPAAANANVAAAPHRIRYRRTAAAVALLAAGSVLAWSVSRPQAVETIARADLAMPATVAITAAVEPGEVAAPSHVAAPTPRLAEAAASPLLAVPEPPMAVLAAAPIARSLPPSLVKSAEPPSVIALATPPAMPRAMPEAAWPDDVAQLAPPAITPPQVIEAFSEPALPPRGGRGGPGLILVAARGDTLQSLYASIYKGLRAPPYEEVVAINKRPFRPGTLVVFPPPEEGWSSR